MEEDHFHKTLIQKKQKLDPKMHKSTPVVQAGLYDSKRPADHFQRGVHYFNYNDGCIDYFVNIYFVYSVSATES